MPFDQNAVTDRPFESGVLGPPQRVAVIGSGISGLSAAWALHHDCDVTVFEKAGRIGGHTATVLVNAPEGQIPVDTGFIVFNEPNYPNLTALFDSLGVRSNATRMNFSVSAPDQGVEYASHGLEGLFAQRRNLVNPQFYGMIRDILRFHSESRTLATCSRGRSIGEFLRDERYGDAFIDHHLLPMAAAIWSCPVSTILDFPAASLARFFVNHGLTSVRAQFPWRSVDGGSHAYLEPLTRGFADRIRCGSDIAFVDRTPGKVRIAFSDGSSEWFDHVVFACHAPQALALLGDASAPERSVLGCFSTQPNRVFLHRDPGLMPERRAAWAAWNYRASRQDELQLSVTYWMNALQRLGTQTNYFVTLNPDRPPAPELVEGEYLFNHPVFDAASARGQKDIWTIQGQQNTWFCGAWQGYGFHEDGIQSGLAVAELLSGWRRPWAFDFGRERLSRGIAGRVAA